MNFFVADTSVVLKWFGRQDESLVKQAILILNDHLDDKIQLIVPDLLLVELANALIFGKTITPPLVRRSIDAVVKSQITIVPVDRNLIHESIYWVDKYQFTAYDAIYLALARQNHCRLISADQKSHGKITDGSVIMLSQYPRI